MLRGRSRTRELPGEGSFREVFLEGRLRDALRRINLDRGGQPWLDEGRVSQAVGALLRPKAVRLIEINQELTKRLLLGTTVDGVEGWDHGRDRAVQFIDWEHPERNDFLVINQFRVDEPGGQGHKYIAPDLVLFVNGIPLVVIEAKSPGVVEPMVKAIRQLRRYANQRGPVQPEGNERLFHTSQFVVATCFEKALVGTFTSEAEHFAEWKTTEPVPEADVCVVPRRDRAVQPGAAGGGDAGPGAAAGSGAALHVVHAGRALGRSRSSPGISSTGRCTGRWSG